MSEGIQIGKEKPVNSDGLPINRAGLALLLGILAAGGWFGSANLVFLSGTLFTLLILARWLSRVSLWRVHHRRRLSQTHAFPGDTVTMTLVLENRKIMPLFWFQSVETVPPDLAPQQVESVHGDQTAGAGRLERSGSLAGYRTQTQNYTLHCRKRGYFTLGPAWITTGDIFGLCPRTMVLKTQDHLIVYPRLVTLPDFSLPSHEPIGETGSRNRLSYDPNRIMGLRDYSNDTPFRHIHWKASARTGRLQARLFEPTTTLQAYVVLDVDGFSQGEAFENAVSLAASVARQLIENGFPAGCLSNGIMVELGRGEIRIQPGAAEEHLMIILEALAVVQAGRTRPFDTFFESVCRTLVQGATLCLVSTRAGAWTSTRMQELRRLGFLVALLDPEGRAINQDSGSGYRPGRTMGCAEDSNDRAVHGEPA
ncbi:MAG: DUF58 domain-containing protein [Pseudomonadota bacterium]